MVQERETGGYLCVLLLSAFLRLAELMTAHILYNRCFDFVQVLVYVFILPFALLIKRVLVVFCVYLQ